MPLNPTTLGAAIKTAMVANLSASNPPIASSAIAQADFQRLADAIATAVCAHITANALVTIVTATATGVTAGAAAVPVTGTGTVS